jgi:hypothetical protein
MATMLICWIRRHPVATATAIITLLFLVLATQDGYEAEFCPLCGEARVEKGIRVIGIPLTVTSTAPGPCLAPDHRLFLSAAAWGSWWKSGYTFIDGYGGGWSRAYRAVLKPWLRARPPGDPDRERVLAAIREADLEQIDELLGGGTYPLLLDGEPVWTPGQEQIDRWGEHTLLPWAKRVH